ncbi:MAG: HAMP domain-containing histidine kinase [Clostridiales bacterium]|nr:HAMP domain-containing histidine kinase [Clostridiales bacterium]
MIKQLRKKFILISTVAVTGVMILLCAGVNILNFMTVTAKLDETLDSITVNRGKFPPADFKPEEDDKLNTDNFAPVFNRGNRKFEREAQFLTRFFVVTFDSSGNVTSSNLDKIAAVTQDDVGSFALVALNDGEGYGYQNSGYRFKVTKNESGEYTAVFLDCQKEVNSMLTLLIVSAGVTVFCIALICVIIVIFSKRAMQPVIQNEIKQKQFITDASHELKTPITVINTCLSVLKMDVGEHKWIDKAALQTEKLKNLVNSLVTLARSDEKKETVTVEFNISDTVNETIESFKDFAIQNNHPPETEIENGILFKGDEYAVRQLVSILTDNALKYSSEGSPVSFTMKKHKKGVVITSSNKCENIDKEDLPKLFDRFYRADKSRSSDSGFGIGLSIAKGICEAHKGSISAKSEKSGEIVFTAYLCNM